MPGPVLPKADLEQIETAFGRRYPSFQGQESTCNLAFYMNIKNAGKPVLAYQTEAQMLAILLLLHVINIAVEWFHRKKELRRKSMKVL